MFLIKSVAAESKISTISRSGDQSGIQSTVSPTYCVCQTSGPQTFGEGEKKGVFAAIRMFSQVFFVGKGVAFPTDFCIILTVYVSLFVKGYDITKIMLLPA